MKITSLVFLGFTLGMIALVGWAESAPIIVSRPWLGQWINTGKRAQRFREPNTPDAVVDQGEIPSPDNITIVKSPGSGQEYVIHLIKRNDSPLSFFHVRFNLTAARNPAKLNQTTMGARVRDVEAFEEAEPPNRLIFQFGIVTPNFGQVRPSLASVGQLDPTLRRSFTVDSNTGELVLTITSNGVGRKYWYRKEAATAV